MDYPLTFSNATWITRIDANNEVTGDYEAKEGQHYRVVSDNEKHKSGPGVTFTKIALPSDGPITEQIFIVPTTALRTASRP